MKRWKKILLGVCIVVAVSQIPSIFNLFQTYQQSNLVASSEFDSTRKTPDGYREYLGVIHVHSSIGGHSYGSFEDIKTAAAANELDFVVMTEHISTSRDTFGKSIEGEHNGVLFISGNEVGIANDNRFLVIEGFRDLAETGRLPMKEFLERVQTPERLALTSHPEKGDHNNTTDGIEVFSLHNSAMEMSKPHFVYDAIWSFWGYPGLTYARHFKRPDRNLALFDRISADRRISLFAGTDAHSNVGFQVGGTTEDPSFELIIDKYEMMFGIVRNHVLLKEETPISRSAVLDAIRSGKSFVGLDVLGNTRGFGLMVVSASDQAVMGDELEFSDDLKLKSIAPQPARFVVFRNGKKFYESPDSRSIEINLKDKGIYRVEVYRDNLGAPFDAVPWIISNPIYIR